MSNEISVREDFSLPAQAQADAQLAAIAVFQTLVHDRLKDGHDYGVIPGTGTKATLLKPGAEKIVKLAKCYPEYIILKEIEDWDREPQPLFAYTVQCKIVYIPTGEVVDNGLGECNSMESKYRWRQGERKCPSCNQPAIIKGRAQYGGGWLCWAKKGGCGTKFNDGNPLIEDQSTERVLNPDIADQNNTILKMAKKRALVDAALSLGSLSDLFTQDLEDVRRTETPPEGSRSPTEPLSEPQGTEQPPHGLQDREYAPGDGPTESDGGLALFPEGPDRPHFSTANELKKALASDIGLDTQAKVEEALQTVGLPVWAEIRDLNDAYATIAHHFAEQAGSDA